MKDEEVEDTEKPMGSAASRQTDIDKVPINKGDAVLVPAGVPHGNISC